MNILKQKFSQKNVAVLIPVFIGIACAMLAIWAFGFHVVDFGDANDYIAAAKSFLNGQPYPRRSEFHPMFRPPLYPLFIAAVWKIFPNSVVAVKVAQALLHGATCFLVYRITYELLKKHVPAFLGALICSVHPLLAAHTVAFFTEPLHTFLLAGATLYIVKILKDDKALYLNAALVGLAYGLATLCRPSALGVAVCLVPVIYLLKVKVVQRSRALVLSGVLLAGMFVAIAPWTIYNYRTTGEFIIVNDGFSYNFWLGSLPETIRLYEGEFKDAEDNQRFANYIWGEVQREKLKELERTDNYSSLKINEREKVWRREAMKNLKQDYSITARIMLGKIKTFWTPFLNRHAYNWKIVAIVAIFVISVYLLSIYGAYILSLDKTGRGFVILLAVSFVVATLIHVLIMGFVRYRAPYVDPYVSMLAGIALWRIGEKLFSKKHLAAKART